MNFKGLSDAEIEVRKISGEINKSKTINTNTIGKIIFTNVFTLFNILNFILCGLIIYVRKYFQASFILLIMLNLTIGLIQEIRAKKTIDKLSLISQPRARVIRNGVEIDIEINNLVLDDIMILDAGRQVCSDCIILEGACEADESLLTGESEPVAKQAGDNMLSGSFVISGKVIAKIINIGSDNYAAQITDGAKKIKTSKSEIPKTLRAIIRVMSIVVVPLGLGTFLKSYLLQKVPLDDSVLKMTASTISLIPQGLVALSSMVFAASVIRIGKYKTLAQDLYCVETLARVDVLCLDKTGTITEGSMVLENVIPIEKDCDIKKILCELTTALPDNNPTADALKNYADGKAEWQADFISPFSSLRKWSGASFKDNGIFIIGACEYTLDKNTLESYTQIINEHSADGKRILCLAQGEGLWVKDKLPNKVIPIAFLVLSDKIRENAANTLKYFYEQDVDIRIISGDNPLTVSAIAERVGFIGFDSYIDMSEYPDEQQTVSVCGKYKIFGRVSPNQKLWIIRELKKEHIVAMTGDGINDVLALKEADCSIAMASGSDAARTVSHLVLLDNNFSALPKIVAEGRRSINNLEKIASLYLVKTVYSILLTILFLFVGVYPFEPMHLTLLGATAIGIPSMVLSFEPNYDIVKGRFLTKVMKDSIPAALSIVLGISILQIVENIVPLKTEQLNVVAYAILSCASFGILFKICKPIGKPLHGALFFTMIVFFLLAWNVFYEFFNLIPMKSFTLNMLYLIVPIGATELILMFIAHKLFYKKNRKYKLLSKILKLDKS